MYVRQNWLTITALFWIALVGILLFSDATTVSVAAMMPQVQLATLPATEAPEGQAAQEAPPQIEITQVTPLEPGATPFPDVGDPDYFVPPYTSYVITQGIHGQSYGHMAIDIAGGAGVPVLSPINGMVTANYVDENGNPWLLIENQHYTVTLLHGDYTVPVGLVVQAGQQVGMESNRGTTADMNGVPCNGRPNCGYHTHLNVFDKTLGANVNPLDLLSP
ncbi:MAG: hypothetical protein GYA17_20990 [Chloroflexi bacterium]|nr:hypothetical protein [Chloroflexota bacterium]